jgi:two-component system, OmpR family, phosphate regulon sensor histidine kinase PhoR
VRRLSLFWKLYLSYLLVIVLALLMVVVGSYAVGSFRESVRAQPGVTLTPPAHLSVESIIFGGCVLICLAAALGLFTSRRISQPLQDMRRGAERFAAGDFYYRLTIPDTVELASLAITLNRMAAQLAEQIAVITQQRNEQEAILESMQEGVLALDTQERVITVNRAAEALLGVVATQAKGHIIQEVVRNVTLQRLAAAAIHSTESATADIVLRGSEERFLQATATALRDAQGQDIGVLVVLNDVTQLRHLENIRRDFVSNVSHELKTPITSIKGFVETLRDGAFDDREHAERFLGIIARHAERLHAIIEDLLALSRLEQGDESYDMPRSETSLIDVVQAAILDCAAKAEAQRVTVVPTCAAELRATVNAPLLEQAIVNLLENAITYSNPDSCVWVSARQDDDILVIDVRDQGVGIPHDHLDRIFERFYRVDKARSRERGGTGLGLAIVKHIAQVHGGQVSVTSTVGEGSTFTMHIPCDAKLESSVATGHPTADYGSPP